GGDRYAHHLDDVRSALEACLADPSDARTAAALVTSSAPLWFHVSQVAEYRDRVEAALELIDQQPDPDRETETWLLNALIIALLHTDVLNPDLATVSDRALAGALAAESRRSEEHTSELQSRENLVCRLLLDK